MTMDGVLATIVAQMAEDAEIIIRAAQQRSMPGLATNLEFADKLAYHALTPALNSLTGLGGKHHGEEWTVITYYQKSHEIRVIPYAPVALVGIPLRALIEDRNLLAIPHEIGHFIYYRRQIDPSNVPLNRHYTVGSDGIRKWQEEVFADVCGLLLAGAVMVFDFQELSKRYNRDAFVELEDHHPSPFLRPLIYSYALRERGDQSEKDAANRFDERWGKELVMRWSTEFNYGGDLTIRRMLEELKTNPENFNNGDPNLPQHLKDVQAAVAMLKCQGERVTLGDEVATLVDRVLARVAFRGNWSDNVDNLNLKFDRGEEDFDEGFGIFLFQHRTLTEDNPEPLETPPPLTLQPNINPWINWVKDEKFFDGSAPGDDPDPLPPQTLGVGNDTFDFYNEPANVLRAASEENNYSWLPLWSASGWVTDPSENHPPG